MTAARIVNNRVCLKHFFELKMTNRIYMSISTLTAPLILGLSIATAAAQEFAVPGRERLRSMSYEEYDIYREQMRDRMNGFSPEERDQMRESGTNGREQMEKRGTGSSYGQGYFSRNGQNTVRGGSGINAGSKQSGSYGGVGARRR